MTSSAPASDAVTDAAADKALFGLPAGETYLNSAYMGPLPRVVQQAAAAALALRAQPWRLTAEDFFAPAEDTRRRCAALVQADPERVAFITSVSGGLAHLAPQVVVRPGQNVVVLGEQFPSNVYPWRRRLPGGAVWRAVPAPRPPSTEPGLLDARARDWNAAVLEAIDADTALVAMEQAHWTDGTLFDLVAIGERCRAVGATFVIDGTQTVGAMPLDVTQVQPDALLVHSYKAGLSSYGLGFMALSPRFADAAPAEDSWLMREGSENFARLVDYADRYAPGMRRFDTPVRANPVMVRMLQAACGLLLQWDPARTREHLLALSRRAVARLQAAGFGVAGEPWRAANLFGVVLPQGLEPETVRERLAAQRIHVSVRGSAVRVSPHRHNDAADLLRLADALIAMR
jgi:selenocysteine lyase/cysteine desulfurase